MHYGGHLRDSFLDWVDEGCPALATVEIDYEPRDVDWRSFMRRMTRCSDYLPGATIDELEGMYPALVDEAAMTYGSVARWLLQHHEPSASETSHA